MKKHFQLIYNSLAIVILALSGQTDLIAQETFNLNTETLSAIQEAYKNQQFKIYPVKVKDVEYYPYVEGMVKTNEYEILLSRISELKPDYDLYVESKQKDSILQADVKLIIANIDKYLLSKEKSNKDAFIIEAQELANKNQFKINGTNTSLFAKTINDYGVTRNNEKEFVLFNGKKISSKKDIEFYKSELQKIRPQQINISHNVRRYLQLQEDEKTITKTEIGYILSDKKSTRPTYFIVDSLLTVKVLLGKFEKLPKEHYLITEDVKGKYSKNELTTDNKEYNEDFKTDRYPIVRKTDTGELYYIMSDQLLFQIRREVEKQEYLNMEFSIDYKVWKSKYINLLSSAQTNVNLCKTIISKHTFKNRFGEKLYDSAAFSSQEKATFNKNLDSLENKLQQIKDLEQNKSFLNYYNDKASIEESTKSYNLSSFYNSTNRAF